CDDQTVGILLSESPDGFRVQAISLFQSARDVIVDSSPSQFQTVPENAGGDDSVDVVITIDGNTSSCPESCHDLICSFCNARKLFRGIQVVHFGGEKRSSLICGFDTSCCQHLCQKRGDREFFCQLSGHGPIERCK